MFLADTHSDTLFSLGVGKRTFAQTDITPDRLRQGGVSLQTLALWSGPKGPNGDYEAVADAEYAAIRQNADNWHADPNQIALCGFSAGAHAVGLLGVHWQEAHWWQEMHLTSADVRPNALILSYPVITAGEFAHRGSFRSLTGTDDIAAHQPHSLENLVTPDTPPTFLWHTWTDGAVPVENTLLMAMALHKAGVPAEVHVFPRGGHGMALGNQVTNIPGEEARKIVPEATVWPELAARFIRQIFMEL